MRFLIPANSKRSQLIFSIFTTYDLILFCVGVGISLLLLVILPVQQLPFAIIGITPGVIAAFLVIPVPNYHNIRTLLKSVFNFYTSRQQYIWKGWDYKDGK